MGNIMNGTVYKRVYHRHLQTCGVVNICILYGVKSYVHSISFFRLSAGELNKCCYH